MAFRYSINSSSVQFLNLITRHHPSWLRSWGRILCLSSHKYKGLCDTQNTPNNAHTLCDEATIHRAAPGPRRLSVLLNYMSLASRLVVKIITVAHRQNSTAHSKLLAQKRFDLVCGHQCAAINCDTPLEVFCVADTALNVQAAVDYSPSHPRHLQGPHPC